MVSTLSFIIRNFPKKQNNMTKINLMELLTSTDLSPEFREFFQAELVSGKFDSLMEFFNSSTLNTQEIYPAPTQIFRVFQLPLEKIKVVILGQDPYHTPGVADGLAFSVQITKLAPSLRNILKEVESDIGQTIIQNGDLTPWLEQGVFLLNNVLTVEKGHAGSHRKIGWEQITEDCIKLLSVRLPHAVFILWGSDAQAKAKIIDSSKHLILQSAHPSPLSAYRGFFGSRPFSKANQFLKSHHLQEIKWWSYKTKSKI